MLDRWMITIPQLTGEEERCAYVYVPDGFDEDCRFPVLYMFDGHNLFDDEEASYGKSWGMLDYLEEHQVPLIIAAVECNHHDEHEPGGGRISEYSPFDFHSRYWGKVTGRGKITMDFFVDEFKPYVDDNYPTIPDRDHTFIAGSSMGGLMTLYAVLCYNEVFSGGAALSPAYGFAYERVCRMIRNAELCGRTVLYMDNGEREFRSVHSRRGFATVARLLTEKKILLETRIVPDGVHSEASWEKQIPFFLNTLLYTLKENEDGN